MDPRERGVQRLSNPKADVRPDPGFLPSVSVLDWLRDTWPRLRINLVPNLLHPPLRPFILPLASLCVSSLPPAAVATALTNHRCNLTQPSRNRSDPPSLPLFPSHHPPSRYIFLSAVVALPALICYIATNAIGRDDDCRSRFINE